MKLENRQKNGKRRNPKNPPEEHQFQPGKSGNPGGVAKGKRISTWMLELGQLSELPDALTLPINGRIALARIEAAMLDHGERSTEIIMDRTEGKLTDIKLLTPAAPEPTPEEKAAMDKLLQEYSEPIEPTFCTVCKGIHSGGGIGCTFRPGETYPASFDPLGNPFDPLNGKRYDLLTGKELPAPTGNGIDP